MKSRIAALALTTLVFGLMATGCPTIPELCDNGACSPVGSADVAQPDSEGGVGPDSDVVTDASPDREPDAPPGCGNANAPWENVDKCVVEGAGVFVSSLAATEGKGTKASPFKTLAKAMASIPTPRRLFVCAGTYTENVTITALVNVHGGFSCADWSYDATKNKVDIVASTEAAGLVVKGVVGEVTVSDVKVVAKSDVGKGKSSVAAFVATSSKVNFVRVTLEAKAGGDAEDGKDGNYTYPSASLLQGKDASGNTGGAGGDTGNCLGGGKSTGGVGGNIGFQGTDGTPSPLGGAKGAGIAACNIAPAGGAGADGRPAPDADPGAGAKVLGSLTAEGWSGKSGDNGKSGTPGGGGGGGYGTAGAGGGGGAGGCGGAGGTGGSAGGSSIALLVLDSEVALVASELVAVDGKPGGSGGTGQTGQSGAFRGQPSGGACGGGNGAKGGDGGQGGGGAGGVSAGIVWSGSKEPTRDVGTKLKPSTGAPAPGGGAGGAKGIDGQNKDVIKL